MFGLFAEDVRKFLLLTQSGTRHYYKEMWFVSERRMCQNQ